MTLFALFCIIMIMMCTCNGQTNECDLQAIICANAYIFVDKTELKSMTNTRSRNRASGIPRFAINIMGPRQDACRFADAIFFSYPFVMYKNVCTLILNALKHFPNGLCTNMPALVELIVLRRTGTKPLSEPMMANLLMTTSLGFNALNAEHV